MLARRTLVQSNTFCEGGADSLRHIKTQASGTCTELCLQSSGNTHQAASIGEPNNGRHHGLHHVTLGRNFQTTPSESLLRSHCEGCMFDWRAQQAPGSLICQHKDIGVSFAEADSVECSRMAPKYLRASSCFAHTTLTTVLYPF